MKVALLSEYTDIGGGESNLLAVAAELSKHVETTLFGFGNLYDEAKKRGINAVEIDLQGRRWIKGVPLPKPSRRLNSLLDHYDIVHAYTLNVLPKLFFLKKPLIWTNHGYWERPRGLRAKVISHFVDHVIAVSQDVYKDAKEIMAEKSIVPLGISTSRFSGISPPVIGSEFNILCIGRFQHIKGQDLLVRAMSEVSRVFEGVSFINMHFVGDVNGCDPKDHAFMRDVHALATTNAKRLTIHFHGFQGDVRPYLEKANLVVIPSRYESFSMVAIEALAAGRPVIAPNIGGPAEIVNSEKIGVLFNPGDHSSLAAAIKFAIAQYNAFDLLACIARGRDFSVSAQAASLMNIYTRVLNAKSTTC